jgi:hypothetical protein
VLRAAGETETTRDNIQDWLELDEGDPGYQLLTEEEIAVVILFIFISCFISFFFVSCGYILLHYSGLSVNPDDLHFKLIWISQSLLLI